MDTQNDIIKSVFAMLDKQLTSKEFDEQIERNRFLAEVKSKKFTRLESMGLIEKNVKRKGQRLTAEERRDIALQGYEMVTTSDMFPSEVAEHFKVKADTFRIYCKQQGIVLPPNSEIRYRRDKVLLKRIIDLINLRGLNLLDASEELEMSTAGVTKTLRRIGYAYNGQTRKVKQIISTK